MRSRNFRMGLIAFATCVAMWHQPAQAQTYPSQDIHFVVGFPAGSAADVLVRYFAERVTKLSGRTVIVENKSGAGGLIAVEHVTRSRPDGHTILFHSATAVANIPALFKNPSIDVTKALEVVAPINRQPFMLAVDAKSPYKTVAELTEAMRKKGDKASYATSTRMGTVMGEIYKAQSGVTAAEVTYRTSADSLNDQLAGNVDYAMHDPTFALAQQRQGRLRVLAVSTGERLEANPTIPTMTEQGVKMELMGWWAVLVPPSAPQATKDQISKWIATIVATPETKKFLNDGGGDPNFETAAQAQKRFLTEVDQWKEYVTLAKIQPQ